MASPSSAPLGPLDVTKILTGKRVLFAGATGFVGRAATTDRGSASGIYLACYFLGGLVGTAVLGQLYDRLGWATCVAGIALSLALAAWLAAGLKLPAVLKAS